MRELFQGDHLGTAYEYKCGIGLQTAPKLVTEGQNNSLCGSQVDMVCVCVGGENKI